MRPFFIIGNKRSGTSQLVRALNLHPQLFVSHESDIAWILYQFHHGQAYRAHAWDSDRGMKVTLESAGHKLNPKASVAENFYQVQLALMAGGTPWLPPRQVHGVEWVGDKKPMQHTDPVLLAFILEHFPEARFLHIVRHPFDVAASSDRFNRTADGDFWLGLSTEQKVERWTYHEEQVWQLRQKMPERIHSLRYEDFCRDTRKVLSAVFEFLEVKADPRLLREAVRQTLPPAKAVTPVPFSPETERMAKCYGYDLGNPPGTFRRRMERWYWAAIKAVS